MKNGAAKGTGSGQIHLVTAQLQYFKNGAEAPGIVWAFYPAVETAGNGQLNCNKLFICPLLHPVIGVYLLCP